MECGEAGGGDMYKSIVGDQRVLDIERGMGDSNIKFDMGAATGQTSVGGINLPTYGDGDYTQEKAVLNLDKYTKGTLPLPKQGDKVRTNWIMDDLVITGYGSSYAEKGLDLWPTSGKGASIQAPFEGVVEESISSYTNATNKPDPTMLAKPTYGNRIKVKMPNGYKIAFAHLDGVNAKKGDTIKPGMVLGYIGNTGTTMGRTGVHADIALWDPSGNELSAEEVAAFLELTNIG